MVVCGSDHSVALHVHEVPAAVSCVAGIGEEEQRESGTAGSAAGAAEETRVMTMEMTRVMTRVMMWGLCTKTRDWQLGVAAQPVAVQLQDPVLDAAVALQAGPVGTSACAAPRLSPAARFVTLAAGAHEWGTGRGERESRGLWKSRGGGAQEFLAPRGGPTHMDAACHAKIPR